MSLNLTLHECRYQRFKCFRLTIQKNKKLIKKEDSTIAVSWAVCLSDGAAEEDYKEPSLI